MAAFTGFVLLCAGMPYASNAQTPEVKPYDGISRDFTPAEFDSYGQRKIDDLCASSQVRDREYLRYLQNIKSSISCPRGATALLNFGRYGYEHPSTTACNAGNVFRTALPSVRGGSSIGNGNAITYISTLISLMFAGCNNAPAPATTATPAPSPTPHFAVSNDTLAFKPGDSPVRVVVFNRDGSASPFFAYSNDPTAVTVSLATRDTQSSTYSFVVTPAAVKTNASTTITVTNSGHKDFVDIAVSVAAATPSPTPTATTPANATPTPPPAGSPAQPK